MVDEQDPGLLTRTYRTVSPRYRSHDDPEMSTIGWTMFLLLVVLFVPLLPVVVLVWLISKALERLSPTR